MHELIFFFLRGGATLANFLAIKCMLKIILELVFLFLYLRIKPLIHTCPDH